MNPIDALDFEKANGLVTAIAIDDATDEVLMVGDWPERDMVGASQLGIRTVFARYGDTFDTIDSGADYDIDDIHEIIPIVERLSTGTGGASSSVASDASTSAE